MGFVPYLYVSWSNQPLSQDLSLGFRVGAGRSPRERYWELGCSQIIFTFLTNPELMNGNNTNFRNMPNERKTNESGKEEHFNQTLWAWTRLSESANQRKYDTIGFLNNTCLCVTRETLSLSFVHCIMKQLRLIPLYPEWDASLFRGSTLIL